MRKAMTENELINAWNNEESIAHIHGWDFSHIADRYTEETDLPWDYQRIILDCLKPEMKLLDIDTGGGEFLRSLHHPYENTSAAEAYPCLLYTSKTESSVLTQGNGAGIFIS